MRRPTIKDVAEYSGVGIGTVSRVLNGSSQISEVTKEKVLTAVKELNYVPNVAGKRLSKNKSNVIALIVPVIDHPYFAKLIEEIEMEADLQRYSLLLVSSQRRIEKEKDVLNRLAQHEADGAIFVTHYTHDESEFKNLAIVSIDRHLGANIPLVTSNNYEATKQGVEYLIDRGCKRIVYLGSKPNQASEVLLIEKAYIDVMKEHGLQPLVINESINHGEEEVIINELFEKYHDDFDGIFVSGCILADVLYEKIRSLHIDCPGKVQIVSYDGIFHGNSKDHMTTLEQPLDLMAKRCIELLIDLINNKNNIEMMNKYNCRFIKGETTN